MLFLSTLPPQLITVREKLIKVTGIFEHLRVDQLLPRVAHPPAAPVRHRGTFPTKLSRPRAGSRFWGRIQT